MDFFSPLNIQSGGIIKFSVVSSYEWQEFGIPLGLTDGALHTRDCSCGCVLPIVQMGKQDVVVQRQVDL